MSPRIADRFTLIHLRGFVVVLRLSFFSAPTGARMYACFLFDEPFEVFQTNRSNRACHMSRTKSPKTSYRNAFMLVHWFPYLPLCEGCVRNLFRDDVNITSGKHMCQYRSVALSFGPKESFILRAPFTFSIHVFSLCLFLTAKSLLIDF